MTLSGGRTVMMSGWAFDQQTWRPFQSGFVRVEPSGLLIPIAYGLHRPDVVAANQIRRQASPGFAVIFSSDVLLRGENILTLELISMSGDRMVTTERLLALIRP